MTPQIIRTVEELEALDPDTQLTRWWVGHRDPIVMTWSDWMGDWGIDGDGIFPLAVIASGDQVRRARKALEEA